MAAIHHHLKPGGKFLSHELLASNKEAEIRKELAQVIRVNSTPLSETSWIQAFATAGLQVQQHHTGSMNLLNWQRMLQEEGIVNTIKILWNILTQPLIRQRVLEMRHVFHKYHQELGYILISAVAQ